MKPLAIAICVACQFVLVIGQLFLKRAMSPAAGRSRSTIVGNFVLGIGCLTAWFFLWLGILERWDLSRVFPFEGLNPALLVLAAWIFLKERISLQTWIGVILICAGIAVVAMN